MRPVKHQSRQVVEIVRVGAAHRGGQERGRLVEQGAVSYRALLHGVKRRVDLLQDRMFQHKQFLNLFCLLAVVGEVVIVTA